MAAIQNAWSYDILYEAGEFVLRKLYMKGGGILYCFYVSDLEYFVKQKECELLGKAFLKLAKDEDW